MAAFLSIDDGVPDHACNCAWDALHKAMSERPGDDDGIWGPHPNPWLSGHVDSTHGRLRDALAAICDALALALDGQPPANLPGLPAGPPSRWSLADWLRLVDALIAAHLPPAKADAEGERLAVRADLLGRVEAALAGQRRLPPGAVPSFHARLPGSLSALPPRLLTPVEMAMIEVAGARAAMAVSDITDAARATMKRLVVDHVEGMVRGAPSATSRILETRLFERFADLNRDTRRLAVTEVGEVAGQGFVTASVGRKVKRMEAYADACSWCRNLHGMVFRVVPADHPTKDGDTMVWPGKTNIGRSSSPAKRVGGKLVPRTPDEMWWPASGTQHPNCRGRWVAVTEAPPSVPPAFASWLDGMLKPAPGK